MAVMKKRSRMVSIRLSEEEYEDLMSCCISRGARSLSDLAREAMQELLESKNGRNGNGKGHIPADGLEMEVEKLHGRMDQLDYEVKRLAGLVCKAAAGV